MSVQAIEQSSELQDAGEQSRRDIQREALQRAVIEALALGASYQKAAVTAGVTRRTILNWKNSDEDFAALAADAIEAGADKLEDEAHRRAMGWEEDVYNKDGERVGSQFKASDRLMEFMLAGRRPEKFRERKATVINVDSRSQIVNALTPEAMQLLEAVAQSRGGGYDKGQGEK